MRLNQAELPFVEFFRFFSAFINPGKCINDALARICIKKYVRYY